MATEDIRSEGLDVSVHGEGAVTLGGVLEQLRRHRADIHGAWVGQMTQAGLLRGLALETVTAATMDIYDRCLDALEAGTWDSAYHFARALFHQLQRLGVGISNILVIAIILRNVFVRWLLEEYHSDPTRLHQALDVFESACNRVANYVAEVYTKEQEETIRELSTPVLQVRQGLLIIPIVGMVTPQRARQLTENLLFAIRDRRARVVVIDTTGVDNVDSEVANHLIQATEAARLLGATVIVTGLSPDVAQTLVGIGVDMSTITTVGDLQGGIEEAERMLGYRVVPVRRGL